jgi:hypothetical protein
MMMLPFIGEGLFPESGLQVIQKFQGGGLAVFVVQAERAEIAGVDSGHQAEFQPAAQHLIGNRDLLGEPDRTIERHHIAHGADAHVFGALGGGGGK